MTQTADRPPQNATNSMPKPLGFTEIGVSGFKSFAEETRIQLGSLTILAGANSSGKSSIMQPLLLMKQTLEAPYDPEGALLLGGPNVSFTLAEQFLAKFSTTPQNFTVRLSINNGLSSKSVFNWSPDSGVDISEQSLLYSGSDKEDLLLLIRPSMVSEEIRLIVEKQHPLFAIGTDKNNPLAIKRERCFLECVETGTGARYRLSNPSFIQLIGSIIHIKGLRGSPERTYNTAAVSGSVFVGHFENYVASIIDRFQKDHPEKLVQLVEALQKLGLTDKIETQRLNDTQIELRVGRVFGQTDTVNIADVGFGVSQVLPVIVALLVAQPGQLVYIEQPEIHLHPRAQIALSEIFADAANRGVRVVVETHSELFMMGIQALVAEDKLDPNAVKLHWFSRQSDGSSQVTSADLDETGAFGDWPEDFGSIALDMANRYLSAAEAKLWNRHNGNSSHG
jgi:predicted ATPase